MLEILQNQLKKGTHNNINLDIKLSQTIKMIYKIFEVIFYDIDFSKGLFFVLKKRSHN